MLSLQENYAPTSPVPNLYNLSPTGRMTLSQSPLNTIQPQGSPLHQLSQVIPPTTWIDNGNRQPPSPTYFLVEDVNRLSLDDKQQEVVALQRSLFPSDRPLSPATSTAKKGMQSNFCSLRHTIKEVAGKKVNKSRLRRL